jgi:hypothetical protein
VVKITIGNIAAVTLMAVFGILALKMTAGMVPFQGYRDLIGQV